jgi:hypothetical protein
VAGRLAVALVHHPVLHRDGSVIAAAITNTDIHDLARSCATYGASRFYVVTPVTAQQQMALRIVHHWVSGAGSRKNADRAHAFSLVEVVDCVGTAAAREHTLAGTPPLCWATSARPRLPGLSFPEAAQALDGGAHVLLLLGTAFGLADEAVGPGTSWLEPILGHGSYNHLSVRAAAAILLDRLRTHSAGSQTPPHD